MMITNKDYFAAACVYNQAKIPDRFKEQGDYYQLKYTQKNGQVIVASSGWDQAGWQQLPNNQILIFEKSSKQLTIQSLT